MVEEIKKETSKPKKIEVDPEVLSKLISDVSQLQKDKDMLLEVADRGRMAHYNTTHKGERAKIYHMSEFGGQIILSWRMLDNEIWKDTEGKWKEKQNIEITFTDASKKMLPYVEFSTKTNRVPVTLLSTTQKGSQTIFEVEAGDGTKYVIDSTYIN